MTRRLAVLALVSAAGLAIGPAPAAAAPPLRLAIECQGGGRTKACPAFLRGIVDETPVLLASPRATAQVVLYVAQAAIANRDRLHLRFVGDVRGGPASIELDVDLDTRATDDDQRAQLRPAFVRGVALFVAALYPDAVTVALGTPAELAPVTTATTPWGLALALSGRGSATGPYKSANASADVQLTRVEPTRRWQLGVAARGGLTRSPAVDGVSFDSTRWALSAEAAHERHLNGCYATEVHTSAWRDDPHGQFRYGWSGGVGLEWDRYPSDDPRGNLLAVGYDLGYRVEGYNFPNVLGQRFAHYPQHRLGAAASVRHDKVAVRVAVMASAEVLHPSRRYTLSASPGVDIQLGAHVDLALDASLTRRELPAFVIPADDPQAVARADYAQPTSVYGAVSVRFHWDPTNGARNNRFDRL